MAQGEEMNGAGETGAASHNEEDEEFGDYSGYEMLSDGGDGEGYGGFAALGSGSDSDGDEERDRSVGAQGGSGGGTNETAGDASPHTYEADAARLAERALAKMSLDYQATLAAGKMKDASVPPSSSISSAATPPSSGNNASFDADFPVDFPPFPDDTAAAAAASRDETAAPSGSLDKPPPALDYSTNAATRKKKAPVFRAGANIGLGIASNQPRTIATAKDDIREAMSNIKLSASAIPDWAVDVDWNDSAAVAKSLKQLGKI